ncbi:MAG: lysophospholipid acyltransferase family protein [Candidatus Hydrogenedentales bacterium]|jgi:lauroyl/myristoyl acyltransferase
MASVARSFIHQLLFVPVLFFYGLTRFMPLSWSRRLGAAFGSLAYWVVPKVKKTGLANIDLIYGPRLLPEEKKQLLHRSVQNLGIVAAEFSHQPKLFRGDLSKQVVIEGLEHIDPDKGCIILGAHHGNWEWMLLASRAMGKPVAAIVREFKDARMDRLVSRVRQSCDITLITKDNALNTALSFLRDGGVVGLLADQNPRQNAVPARFYGQETWATIGPALFALRAKVPIHPVAMIRQANGSYRCTFYPALELQLSGDLWQDLRENTQRCQNALERIIRPHSDQWLWLHRRWKPRKRLAEEWKQKEAKYEARRHRKTQPIEKEAGTQE